ncbi:FkbM family methyltransferase [Phyllobacterium myrsinacearum]|uniref:Methyltransferase FkbM domain-containing protein n=1 Tax=Phyllobacterium myrsinacearum TaxID=28101 RepID=A0A2S9JIH9_9HYPH|nr:FkbM family methyltransferase [Phyllobacterium myrsinacearum]PRD52904.1 hypothetical protein C5750_10765 [Phyllobacterium myrsinacearum]PWV94604.1 FkbM family methyltransferase [Phyllobacterium myrsinacearum]RZV07287.1 FkbM family methyltransferase [Phyllobacterium myrsinacearum]
MLDLTSPDANIMQHTRAVHTRHGEMCVLTQDDPIGRSLVQYGEWAEAEIEFLLHFIAPGNVVIDAGANIGTHTIPFAKAAGPAGHVIAIEPQNAIVTILDHNLQISGCTNVTTHRAGAGEHAGEMFIPRLNYQGRANFGGISLQLQKNQANVSVPLIAIDDLSLPELSFAKIDAEGMDADVLIGMRNTVQRLRPVIYVECNSVDDGAGIKSALGQNGYKFFLARTAAYNARNFAECSDNIFGVACETGLLLLPDECLKLLPPSTDRVEIIEVQDLQTLAEALLATPRYGDLTPADRNWRKLLPELRNQQQIVQQQSWDIKRLKFRETSVTEQLERARREATLQSAPDWISEMAMLREEIRMKEAALSAVYNSMSWRASHPLRVFKRLLSKRSFRAE